MEKAESEESNTRQRNKESQKDKEAGTEGWGGLTDRQTDGRTG